MWAFKDIHFSLIIARVASRKFDSFCFYFPAFQNIFHFLVISSLTNKLFKSIILNLKYLKILKIYFLISNLILHGIKYISYDYKLYLLWFRIQYHSECMCAFKKIIYSLTGWRVLNFKIWPIWLIVLKSPIFFLIFFFFLSILSVAKKGAQNLQL